MIAKRLLCVLALFVIGATSIPAHAWGCEGHEIVALIAMRHLQSQVANQANAILSASPVSAKACGCQVECERPRIERSSHPHAQAGFVGVEEPKVPMDGLSL